MIYPDMGTDVNMCLERRRKQDQDWHIDPDQPFDDPESYSISFYRQHEFFGLLNSEYRTYGTRYSIPERGMPPDATQTTLDDYNREGSNNWQPNHMSLDEYIKIVRIHWPKHTVAPDPQAKPFVIQSNNFVEVANYCLWQVAKSQSEAILLDAPGIELEYRIIIYFDN